MSYANKITYARFRFISKIYTGNNRGAHNEHMVDNLYYAVKFFIKEYPEVFNVECTLDGMLTVLTKCIEGMHKSANILDEYYQKYSKEDNMFVIKYGGYICVRDSEYVHNGDEELDLHTFQTAQKRLSIFLDCMKRYETDKTAVLELISQIFTGENDTYEYYDECIYNLLLSVNEFIKIYPEVFNVKNDIEGILDVIVKYLKQFREGNDILQIYYEKNKNNQFSKYYEEYKQTLLLLKKPRAISNEIKCCKTAKERINLYLEYIINETK